MKFDVHITERLLMKVAMRRIFRRWPLTLLAVGLIIVSTVMDLRGGLLGAVSIFGLTATAILALIYVAYYLSQRQSIRDWKRMQGSDPVNYELTEETLKATSNLGSTELKWTVFQKLLEHPDYLLLSMGRSGQLTLPLSDVPAEAVAFIRQRFAALQLPTKKA
ncbi:MAG: hypothetical protein RL693_923 [Verrucomicrobiota bacterium]|jgi:hypothetical protein